MQHFLTFDEIKVRAARIRLSPGDLAKRAGKAASTAYRLGRHDHHTSTIRALQAALEAEERAMLRDLLPIHGCRLVEPLSPAALAEGRAA